MQVQEDINRLMQSVADLVAENQRIVATRAEIEESRRENTKLRKQNATIRAAYNKMYEKYEDSEAIRLIQYERIATLTKILEHNEAAIESYREEILKLRIYPDRLQKQEKMLKELQNQVTENRKKIASLQQINTSLNKNLDVLEESEANLRYESSRLAGILAKNNEIMLQINEKANFLEADKITMRADIDKYRQKYKAARSCCAVCFEKTPLRVAYVCSHVAVCRDCDKKLTNCPVCRALIVMRMNIILS